MHLPVFLLSFSRHGRCEKPGCSCTKAKAGRSNQLGFKMCKCGHVFDAHALVVGGSKPGKPLATRQRGWVLPQKQVLRAWRVWRVFCAAA